MFGAMRSLEEATIAAFPLLSTAAPIASRCKFSSFGLERGGRDGRGLLEARTSSDTSLVVLLMSGTGGRGVDGGS